MAFRLRKTIRFGPIRFNLSNSGVSTSVKVGLWSWNSRSRRHSVDLPGPVNWRSNGRRRR